MHVGRLQTGIAAAARIADVHRLPTELIDEARVPISIPPMTSPPAEAEPIVRFDGVVAGYGDTPVLRGVDLVIPRRGHVAVVGPSGAGKSTAFGVLMRFVEPSAGSVSLDGRELSSLSIRAVRQQIAYVEQSAPWIPGSLRENVRYRHPDADDAEVRRALDAVGLLDIADALPHGLDSDIDGDEFSGGERARVAFARAILRPPAIILLDEATAQLDGIGEASVRRLVADLARVSVVVTIAHRLSTVIDADRIYVFDAGRTRASGTHVELLESDEMYRRLVSGLRMAPLAS